MQVALAQDQVVLTPHFHFEPLLWVKQHLVTGLNLAYLWPDRNNLCPHQPLGHLRRRWNEQATARRALTFALRDADQNAVVQHLDGRAIGFDHDAPTVPSGTVPRELLRLTAADGTDLEAELSIPDEREPRAGFALAHPHPLHGGNMTSIVISTWFYELAHDCVLLRFNFRGVGTSTGTHEYGDGERRDITAAIDALAPIVEGLPLVLAGWSFGADTSLGVDDVRLAGWLLAAPPLRPDALARERVSADPRPKRFLIPEHDNFCPPEEVNARTIGWHNSSVEMVAGTDHFFVGRTQRCAQAALGLLDELGAP